MTATAPRPRTRRPTGKPPWPIVLVEGAEKVGKTWESLAFSGDERIDRTFVLDLNEGCADEYGAIPGADFEILEHDGTWHDIIGALEWAVAESEKVAAAELVPYLVVDTGTAEWAMLREWADVRAKRTKTNREKLARDPDAEIKAPRNVWNDVDARHATFMKLIRSFKGPKVITARGKWVSATNEKTGQPIPDQKEYRVEGQKNLGYDANAWIRLSRDQPPIVVGLRSVRWGIRPGIDEVHPWPDFSLGKLIFETIGCEPGKTTTAEIPQLDADQIMPGEEPPPAEEEAPAPQNRQATNRFYRQRETTSPAPAAEPSEEAAAHVWALLTCSTEEEANKRLAAIRGQQVGREGILSLLDESDQEILGVPPGTEAVSLIALAARVVAYVKKHQTAIRAAQQGDAPAA